MQARGFAIIDGGVLDVGTVSPHARGAKANWLYKTANVVVLNTWSDFLIERSWQMHRGKAECVPVTILAWEDAHAHN